MATPEEERRRGRGPYRSNVPITALILVFIGVVLLLQTTGVLPWGVWDKLWRFWPVLLVALGLSMLFSRRAPGLTFAAVALLMAGSVGGAVAWNHYSSQSTAGGFKFMSEPLLEVNSFDLSVSFGAGKLEIGSLASSSPLLIQGQFGTAVPAHLDLNRKTTSATLAISPQARVPGSSSATWNIQVSSHPDMTLDVNTGAAQNVLDLSNLQVHNLQFKLGAASATVTMPAKAGQVTANMNVGASSLTVIIPQGVAARINASSGLSSVHVDTNRFPKNGSVYESSGYATATNKIDLTVSAGAASITVK